MNISEEAQDILQEIINTGLGNAAVSFSEMLEREIKLTFPELVILNYKQIKGYLNKLSIEEVVTVHQDFSGGLEGKSVVAFPLFDGKTMVNYLFESDQSLELELGILEKETILEVGNVLINALAASIAEMINQEVRLNMPELHLSKDIVDVKTEDRDKIYCIGKGSFSVDTIKIEGMILIILSYKNIQKITEALSYM